MKIGILLAGLAFLSLNSSLAQITPNKPASKAPSETIVDIIAHGTHFKKLLAALKVTGLDKTLSSTGLFTLFAPSDAAFAKIPKATLDQLMANKTLLEKILLYHVVAGKLTVADLIKQQTVKTAEGTTVQISNIKNILRINKSRMAKAGVQASNGTIYVIGLLLVPKN